MTLICLWIKPQKERSFFSPGHLFIDKINQIKSKLWTPSKNKSYWGALAFNLAIFAIIALTAAKPAQNVIEPILTKSQPLAPIEVTKSSDEVMGFAPYWNFNKLDGIDFSALTTLAYFSVPVLGDGSLDTTDPGYQTYMSPQATDLFKKAHANGTRVVLTLTQMNNGPILALLDNPQSQTNAINQITDSVKERGIDGVNIDFEYAGNPGDAYRTKFTNFVQNLTDNLHAQVPNSYITVSVYAASVKDPKIYDIKSLSSASDGIFMMAYDFATRGADQAMPTAPLYGHSNGTYWYDVSTAVNDFLAVMPADKLILGVPWYGYDYVVYQPGVKSETLPSWSWKGSPVVQTYATASTEVSPSMNGIDGYTEGWDPAGEVGYKAYHVIATDAWRIIFFDDVRSLGLKYDYALNKNLKGIGIWALGMDNGQPELWNEIKNKFGIKLADTSLVKKAEASTSND